MSRVITSTSKSLGERAAFDKRWRGGGGFWRPRRLAIVIAALATAAWLGVQAGTGGNELYNPGPLTGAHARWEHNCNVCHAGVRGDAAGSGGGSVFFKTVSDAACTKCHEAPLHHPNQTRLANLSTGTATQCATCHVEHKGAASLTALSDAQCTQCHANIGPETSRTPTVATSITAFSASGHPHFGSSMRGTSRGGLGAWANPTRLQFDHAKHFGREGIQSCASCHTADRGAVSTTRPWKGWATTAGVTPSGAPGAEAGSSNSTGLSDNAYMRAVTYEEHCKRCHALSLSPPWPGGPELVHDDMAHVRLQLAQQLKRLPDAYAKQVADNPKLLEQPGKPPLFKRVKKPQAEWIPEQISHLPEEIDKRLKRQESLPSGWPARDSKSTAGPSLAQVEYFVAFATAQSCSKCHTVAPPAASAPQASGAGLATLPTGITHPVRRWFPAGRFSHRAHRNMNCADCHANVGKVPDAANVFLPDLSPLATGPGAAGQSCVECHHPPTSRERGAPASCVTCHNYHDHGREKHPMGIEGPLPTIASAPATAVTVPPDGAVDPAGTGSDAEPSPDVPSSQ